MKYKIEADNLLAKARGNWHEIMMALAGANPELVKAINLNRSGKFRQHTFCPVHGGKHGDAFRLFKDFAESGGGICNTCGCFANGISLLQFITGENFYNTLKMVNDYLEGNSGREPRPAPVKNPVPTPSKEEEAKKEKKNRFLISLQKEMWNNSLPLQHPEAELARKFLGEVRKIDLERFFRITDGKHNYVISFHPSLPLHDQGTHKTIGSYPCIIIRFIGPDNKAVTIHRHYLDNDGNALKLTDSTGSVLSKLLVPFPENLSLSGSACRLGPVINGTLGIAEGMVTALSAMTLASTDLSVWSVYNNKVMEGFVPPENLRKLLIFADNDPPQEQLKGMGAGLHSALKLKERLSSSYQQLEVQILLPRIPGYDGKCDWNDVLVHLRKEKSVEADKQQKIDLRLYTQKFV